MWRLGKLSRLAGVVLLAFGAGCDRPLDPDDDHLEEIVAVEVTDMSGGMLASYMSGVWTFPSGDGLHLHPGEELGVRILFVAADGDRFQLPHGGAEHTVRVDVADSSVAAYDGHGDHGHFEAIGAGETTATIQAFHGSHADFSTNPGLPIEVVDHGHD